MFMLIKSVSCRCEFSRLHQMGTIIADARMHTANEWLIADDILHILVHWIYKHDAASRL